VRIRDLDIWFFFRTFANSHSSASLLGFWHSSTVARLDRIAGLIKKDTPQ